MRGRTTHRDRANIALRAAQNRGIRTAGSGAPRQLAKRPKIILYQSLKTLHFGLYDAYISCHTILAILSFFQSIDSKVIAWPKRPARQRPKPILRPPITVRSPSRF